MGGSSEHDRGCSVWVQPFPRSQTFLSLDTFDRPVRLDVPKSDLNEVLSLSELEMNAQGKKIEESDLIAAHLKKGKGRGGGRPTDRKSGTNVVHEFEKLSSEEGCALPTNRPCEERFVGVAD
jgi:hypothetical protein